MFFTGIIPILDYTLPALAGILLIPLVIEIGKKTALVSFGSVSILSILITPNKEAAILFIAFFGYYPILKSYLESIKSRFVEWTVKIIVFNIALMLAFFIATYLFNLSNLLDAFELSLLILYPLLNFIFIIYDLAISRLIQYYINVLRYNVIKTLKL